MTHKFWRVHALRGLGERKEGSVVQGLCVIGMEGEVPEGFVSSFFIGKFKRTEIRKWEGRNSVTQVVTYLGYPDLPKSFTRVRGLVLCVVGLLLAVACNYSLWHAAGSIFI